jgi:hypothetical protein
MNEAVLFDARDDGISVSAPPLVVCALDATN